MAGLVLIWNTTLFNLDGQLAWKSNGDAGGIDTGNVIRVDLSLQKRLASHRTTIGEQRFIFGGIELNYEDEGRSRTASAVIPDTRAGADCS